MSRIAALERELDEERARARDQANFDRTRIAILEHELADRKRHADTAPRPPPRASAPAVIRPIDELDTPLAGAGPPVSVPAVITLLVFTATVIAFAIGLM